MAYKLECVRLERYLEGDFLAVPWEKIPISSPFVHACGKNEKVWRTLVQTAWDRDFLYVRFQCEDGEILATMLKRDEPLYDQEVVEVFLAPHSLHEYYEFNLSPRNVVYDSFIKHDGVRHHGHPEWNCYQLQHGVIRHKPNGETFGDWDGYLAIPFACLQNKPNLGESWRANFYRIKRVGGEQYLAWSPTYVNPAYFHVPDKFGELVFI